MLISNLLSRGRQGLKKQKKDSKTAKVLMMVILILAVFLVCQLILTPLALAQDNGDAGTDGEVTGDEETDGDEVPAQDFGLDLAAETDLVQGDLIDIIVNVINALMGLLGLVAVIIIIYGGFLYLTSAGEEEKIKKAKKSMVSGVIGLVLVILSWVIAQFIFSLFGAGIWGRGRPGGPPGVVDGGALGNGIIESVYPTPGQQDVPRNTNIVVTFKEAILVSTIIADTNGSGDRGDCIDANNDGKYSTIDVDNDGCVISEGDTCECDLITDNIEIREIYNKDDFGANIPLNLVIARKTEDDKTFVFKPVRFLGNPNTPTPVVVSLTNEIQKANGDDAFGVFDGFNWGFEVSTKLDLTPPQVKRVKRVATPEKFEVFPEPGEEAFKNAVIHIEFNEAINPLTASGTTEVGGDEIVGPVIEGTFDKILAYLEEGLEPTSSPDNINYIGGEFMISNQYRTISFISNDPCGVNSCGETIYCLPGNEIISVLMRAATTEVFEGEEIITTSVYPYTGVADMSDNSFDGNLSEQSEGPYSQSNNLAYDINDKTANFSNQRYQENLNQGDDAKWTFRTNNEMDITPPQALIYYPNPERGDLPNPYITPQLTFDELMWSATINSQNIYIIQPEGIDPEDMVGFWFSDTTVIIDDDERTRATMRHSKPFLELTNYGIETTSDVYDRYQNCYLPCAEAYPSDIGEDCIRIETGVPGQYRCPETNEGIWRPSCEEYPSCQLDYTEEVVE